MDGLPVIDVAPLIDGGPGGAAVARSIGEACRAHGFFYVTRHGVDAGIIRRLEDASRRFSALVVGGLAVHTRNGWIAAPPIPGSFVCNIGDMLDRMTGGRYRSTPHRVVRNTSGRDRLSFPLFFDPNFEARVQPIEGLAGTVM
ncbi:MAG: 2OG-Fe(II) oxygenase family protein [Lautropia sp.]